MTAIRDAQGVTREEFIAETFEHEPCGECGQDADRHMIGKDMFGNWHAWCEEDAP